MGIEMNIKQAKEEIVHTVKAYLLKDGNGRYRLAPVRQRPLLFIGPPGIGKTAIVEQAARECQVACVSYTITHHTRQSAMGLPMIERREFGGKEYSITEYTMSEIVASIYDAMEAGGRREGILFIDEINCVSETLAPAMLQFLQGKTFGSHKIPEGWVIVAAGNPPEYNRSVREFDIVTLDRVRRIDIEEDYGVWKEYAYEQGIHEAILSYLDIRRDHFYHVETTVDGKEFVTARGWEDLSGLLYCYRELSIPVEKEIVAEYLQHPAISAEFANYLKLYYKYDENYNISEILAGSASDAVLSRAKAAPFDERLSVVSLLLGKLFQCFRSLWEEEQFLQRWHQGMKRWSHLLSMPDSAGKVLAEIIRGFWTELDQNKRAGLWEAQEETTALRVMEAMEGIRGCLMEEGIHENEAAYEKGKELFSQAAERQETMVLETSKKLSLAFDFLTRSFGEGQELVVFVTELTANRYSIEFLGEYGSEEYEKYQTELLFHDKRKKLQKKAGDFLL